MKFENHNEYFKKEPDDKAEYNNSKKWQASCFIRQHSHWGSVAAKTKVVCILAKISHNKYTRDCFHSSKQHAYCSLTSTESKHSESLIKYLEREKMSLHCGSKWYL